MRFPIPSRDGPPQIPESHYRKSGSARRLPARMLPPYRAGFHIHPLHDPESSPGRWLPNAAVPFPVSQRRTYRPHHNLQSPRCDDPPAHDLKSSQPPDPYLSYTADPSTFLLYPEISESPLHSFDPPGSWPRPEEAAGSAAPPRNFYYRVANFLSSLSSFLFSQPLKKGNGIRPPSYYFFFTARRGCLMAFFCPTFCSKTHIGLAITREE